MMVKKIKNKNYMLYENVQENMNFTYFFYKFAGNKKYTFLNHFHSQNRFSKAYLQKN